MTPRADLLDALTSESIDATLASVHDFVRLALARARFSWRRFLRASRLSSDVIDGAPRSSHRGSIAA